MATIKDDIEKIDEKVNSLITLNQKTYVRGEDLKPIDTSWTLKEQNEMFNTLMQLTQELQWVKQKVQSIF